MRAGPNSIHMGLIKSVDLMRVGRQLHLFVLWKAVVVWFLPWVSEELVGEELLGCKVRMKSFVEAVIALPLSPASSLTFSL